MLRLGVYADKHHQSFAPSNIIHRVQMWMRSSYTIQKKEEIVEWHRKDGIDVSKTARHFEVDRKRVWEWNTKYQVLVQQSHGKTKLKRMMGTGPPVFSEEIEDCIDGLPGD
ncbi:hypothetical protein HPB47_006073 [Ixodes persulcatus]|uniref:Uncharacterized protein n=1 Tax=Ixodes persulcatus TaxID=34615 RepID=A0AC60PBD3_IXOPE|nr:hypothetical protein HPB47_006073 [Ixodes persulcatus]